MVPAPRVYGSGSRCNYLAHDEAAAIGEPACRTKECLIKAPDMVLRAIFTHARCLLLRER